ncbi:MAG: 30S ribosomal protein S16 [Patescibacteria group bacterium]
MLMIRLQRRGKKHQASYRLVVGEKRSKLNGKQLEVLGWHDPHKDASSFDKERILYWMKNGAQMSDTVNNLLLKNKIIEGKKIAVHKQPKKVKEEKAEDKKEEGKKAE